MPDDARLARIDDRARSASSASENPCSRRAVSYCPTSRDPNSSGSSAPSATCAPASTSAPSGTCPASS
ncbi:Uncharacterised protein [Mycobacteroides abscessus]|nr:Uncharacterised protein [Mycobacteroides abscessus]